MTHWRYIIISSRRIGHWKQVRAPTIHHLGCGPSVDPAYTRCFVYQAVLLLLWSLLSGLSPAGIWVKATDRQLAGDLLQTGGQISDRGLWFSAGVLLSEYYLSGLASTTDFLLGTSPLEHRISSTDQPNRQGLLVPVPSLIINSRIEERPAALCSLRILAGTHPCLWPLQLNPLFQPVFLASLRRGRGPCMRVCADHGLLLGVWQWLVCSPVLGPYGGAGRRDSDLAGEATSGFPSLAATKWYCTIARWVCFPRHRGLPLHLPLPSAFVGFPFMCLDCLCHLCSWVPKFTFFVHSLFAIFFGLFD